MRFIKGLMLVAGLFVFSWAFYLLAGEGTDSEVQAQSGKPTMWGDDVLVHQGSISRYLRNGYSADYDDDYDVIFAAVTGYSSGPDTCFIYLSVDGGENWIPGVSFDTTTDFSNPQVVIGEGANPYQFYFMLDHHAGEIILKRMYQTTLNTYILTDGVESFAAIRDDPGDNYYLHLAQARTDGRIFFSYSTNFGVNWQRADTVHGDQPHICTAGPNGQDVFMTWRMDGEKGALCCVKTQDFFTKGLNLGVGNWDSEELDFSTSGGGYDSCYCILQTTDGNLYVGVTDAGEHVGDEQGKVFKSTDGGEHWSSTGELTGAERVLDLAEDQGWIFAAASERARLFMSTNGGQTWTDRGFIGGTGDLHAHCLALDAFRHDFYAGTGDEGDVFKTTDSGASWSELAELAGADRVLDIIVLSSDTLLAAAWADGDSIGMFRSTNDGASWQEIRPAGVKWVYSLFQASDKSVYAAVHTSLTPSQRVLRSTDDGASWDYTAYEESDGRMNCITEDSDGVIYVTNASGYVKKSTNHGAYWTYIAEWHAENLNDVIVSTPQIMVKKGSSRGTVWHVARNVSWETGARSDPKVAATQVKSDYAVWVVYTQERPAALVLPSAYSTDQGATWYLGSMLAYGTDNAQLCDLAVARGNSSRVHAAYCDDVSGNRRLYYKYSDVTDPSTWSPEALITTKLPTLKHTPEICFYQGNSLVFLSWGFGIPFENPNHLYVNALTWTGVEEAEESEASVPKFTLSHNYPNPFNPSTSIQYTVDSRQVPSRTTLKIYNIRGQLVRTLVDEPQGAGFYHVIWDGKSDNGKDVASGIYFYELEVGDYSQTKKMVLIR